MVDVTGQTEVNFQQHLSHKSNSYWHVIRHNASLASQTQNISHNTTCFDSFPFNNFKYFLTLFSKFFASFPHGTCSLSVSCHYLALDGIYHPFRAALPSNSTRGKTVVRHRLLITNGVLTLHDSAFQPNSIRAVTDMPSIDYNSDASVRFTSWAFPASFAITEGILVSLFSSG